MPRCLSPARSIWLAVAQDLDPNQGLSVPRRSLYFLRRRRRKCSSCRSSISANPVECYRRSESIAPQQALAMANSTLTLAQARILARET